MSLPAVKLKDLTKDQRGELADSVLCAYDEGASIEDQASKLGISASSLYSNLLIERPEEWRATRSGIKAMKLDKAIEMMEDAKDQLELSKGRELAARHAWELERINPNLYGQKKEQHPQIPVLININLRGNQEKVVSEDAPLLDKGD